MYSMIRTRLEAGGSDPLILIYGARSDRDLAFHSGFLDLAKQYSNFKYNPVVGRTLNMDLVRSHVSKNTQVYICGPTPMMDALAGGLMELAVPDDNIHTERFVSPQSLDASRLVPRRSEISLDGQVFIYDGKQPLLDFFENAGVEIPYACRTGVCGTCKCRARGETESLTDAGLSLRERRDGWILTCVSFPRSDRLELKRK
jgi:ferredoxin